MELDLERRYELASSPDQAWALLRDLRATASCMPGAQITEQMDATHHRGSVRSRVGPATLVFLGDIELLDSDVQRREIRLFGKGADKSGSSASMRLTARIDAVDGTAQAAVLVGTAVVQVHGKLAQFGSRLLLPVMDALLAQFATNFSQAATAMAATEPLGNAALPAQTAPDLDPAAAPLPLAPSPVAAPAPASNADGVSSPRELSLGWLLRLWLRGWWSRWRGVRG